MGITRREYRAAFSLAAVIAVLLAIILIKECANSHFNSYPIETEDSSVHEISRSDYDLADTTSTEIINDSKTSKNTHKNQTFKKTKKQEHRKNSDAPMDGISPHDRPVR